MKCMCGVGRCALSETLIEVDNVRYQLIVCVCVCVIGGESVMQMLQCINNFDRYRSRSLVY